MRLDLHGAKPPVWRRLELPGDLTLPRVHDVIQAAMGWSDSHLHRFRTGNDHRSPYFVTHFDLDEGEDGVLEDDVRLDQLVAPRATSSGTSTTSVTAGTTCSRSRRCSTSHRRRCAAPAVGWPARPRTAVGIGGYEELAAWVRSGYDDALLPDVFDDAAHARDWLPLDWHPDHFDVEETNAALAVAVAEPVAVTGELAELAEQLERRGIRLLREVLGRPLSHGPTEVTDAEAARLTETYRIFLDVIGDGVALTAAGYLPPTVVEQFAERSGITEWWIGKANREDLTTPVADVRDTARALGLVTVRKGRLTPTAAGIRCRQDPQALWQHIVGRLPLGTKDADRHAGWMALAVAGSGVPAQEWRSEISDLLFALGWRSGSGPVLAPARPQPDTRRTEPTGRRSTHRLAASRAPTSPSRPPPARSSGADSAVPGPDPRTVRAFAVDGRLASSAFSFGFDDLEGVVALRDPGSRRSPVSPWQARPDGRLPHPVRQ